MYSATSYVLGFHEQRSLAVIVSDADAAFRRIALCELSSAATAHYII